MISLISTKINVVRLISPSTAAGLACLCAVACSCQVAQAGPVLQSKQPAATSLAPAAPAASSKESPAVSPGASRESPGLPGTTSRLQTPAQAQADKQVKTQGQPSGQVNIVEMRLSGSMCMSCLLGLEKRLKEIAGVSKVKIEFPVDTYYNSTQVPAGGSWAEATLHYDSGLTSLDKIKLVLYAQGYHPYKIVEKH